MAKIANDVGQYTGVRGIDYILEIDVVLLAVLLAKIAMLVMALQFVFSVSAKTMIVGHDLVGLEKPGFLEVSMGMAIAALFAVLIASRASETLKVGSVDWSEWAAARLDRAVVWLSAALASLQGSVTLSVHQKLLDKYSRSERRAALLKTAATEQQERSIRAEKGQRSLRQEYRRLETTAIELEARLDASKTQERANGQIIAELTQRLDHKRSQAEAASLNRSALTSELARERRTVERLQKQLGLSPGVRVAYEPQTRAAAEVEAQLQSVLMAIGAANSKDAVAKIAEYKAATATNEASFKEVKEGLEKLLDAVGTRDVDTAVDVVAERHGELTDSRKVVSELQDVLQKLNVANVTELRCTLGAAEDAHEALESNLQAAMAMLQAVENAVYEVGAAEVVSAAIQAAKERAQGQTAAQTEYHGADDGQSASVHFTPDAGHQAGEGWSGAVQPVQPFQPIAHIVDPGQHVEPGQPVQTIQPIQPAAEPAAKPAVEPAIEPTVQPTQPVVQHPGADAGERSSRQTSKLAKEAKKSSAAKKYAQMQKDKAKAARKSSATGKETTLMPTAAPPVRTQAELDAELAEARAAYFPREDDVPDSD